MGKSFAGSHLNMSIDFGGTGFPACAGTAEGGGFTYYYINPRRTFPVRNSGT
jgi:hypothetical protein